MTLLIVGLIVLGVSWLGAYIFGFSAVGAIAADRNGFAAGSILLAVLCSLGYVVGIILSLIGLALAIFG